MKQKINLLMMMLLAGIGSIKADSELWIGTHNAGNWDNRISISRNLFAGAVPGDIIRVTISGIDFLDENGSATTGDSHDCVLQSESTWSTLPGVDGQTAAVGSLDFTLTEEAIQLLRSSNLSVTGKYYQATSVSLVTLGRSETDLSTTETGINWSKSLPVAASYFSSLQVNDLVEVSLDGVNEGDSPTIRDQLDWESFSNVLLNNNKTNMTVLVTDENIPFIKRSGINIAGGGSFDVTAVKILKTTSSRASCVSLLGQLWDGSWVKDYEDGSIPEGTKVLVQKSLQVGNNTICLPFATTAEAIGGEDAQAYELTSASPSFLTFKKVSSMEANKPYILTVTAAKPNIIVTSVTLQAETASETTAPGSECVMRGNYERKQSGKDKYGINSEGNIQKGGENAKLPAFGAYFENIPSGGAVKALFVDDATGITTMKEMKGNGLIYNLAGQRVSHPTHGFYVVNGKKIMIR